MIRKVLSLIGVSFVLLSGIGFCDIKYEDINYSIESSVEMEKIDREAISATRDSKLTSVYATEETMVDLRFEVKEEYHPVLWKASFANKEFKRLDLASMNTISTSRRVDGEWIKEEYSNSSFSEAGIYLFEVLDLEQDKTIERIAIFIGGYDEAVGAAYERGEMLDYNANLDCLTELELSYYDGHNASITSKGNRIYVEGIYDLDDQKYMMIQITEEESSKDIKKEVDRIRSGGNFKAKVSNRFDDGRYQLGLYTSEKEHGRFYSYVYDIEFIIEDGELYFEESPVFDHNKKLYDASKSQESLDDYLKEELLLAMDNPELIKIAEQVTRNKKTDYDKILAIHDWVANNIYYDYDGYYSGEKPSSKADDVLESKKSVCGGYANLTTSLARLSGIPCRKVSGYALGIDSDNRWTKNNINNTTNHAWNEAYVDGRWIILDTTWSSRNKFEKDHFIKKNQNRAYFDSTLEFFSLTHKIMKY